MFQLYFSIAQMHISIDQHFVTLSTNLNGNPGVIVFRYGNFQSFFSYTFLSIFKEQMQYKGV